MKALLQRVSSASVSVDGDDVGSIQQGLLVFLGIAQGDTEAQVKVLVEKIVNLRLFEADGKHFCKSLLETKKEVLIVSQFTLCASFEKGRRPDFFAAAQPDFAHELYEHFVQLFCETGLKVETGQFGAKMQVELVNDGPVTFLLEQIA